MTVDVKIGYFTPEECSKIIARTEELFISHDRRHVHLVADGGERDWLSWPRDEDFWLWQKMQELYPGAERFRYQAVNRYNTGDCMVPHKDDTEGDCFVIMVFLNDDYEGGDLIFYNDGEEHIAPKGIGNALVYHGGIEHGVTKITKGTRYTVGQLVYTTETYPEYLR